ncbi:Flagellar protein FlgJ [Photobacterium marinum]|uniref:Peptidoglycan hydrolase FlgJ n=1 Tax=Photobacterium marinum TaxID=1056511 RepID=L8JCL0_9GAMM|nr:flagellar assembly peptidoglycan hydrolase FlgJ [Photobacterium marinum]ELR65127.1 Flagellar protein FlgJ [Photobacterium marinum]
MKTTDPGFIHDISNLERLRAGIKEDEGASLKAAAQQFEAIFTQMLFKSMREANEAFESDLMSSSNTKFFEQMHDEQMASELSATGSLGLADLIVEQLGGEELKEKAKADSSDKEQAQDLPLRPAAPQEKPLDDVFASRNDDSQPQLVNSPWKAVPQSPAPQPEAIAPAAIASMNRVDMEQRFESPEDFVSRMRPYAEKAANALGTDPSVLIAQAALETGWGKKVVKNAVGSSNNLFNIKADPRWSGSKVATRTLEFHNGIPVQENAAFRSYDSYQESFNDYVSFLNTNPRYSEALQQPEDPVTFIRNLHKAGYATDPNYSDKIISVMDRVNKIMK